MSNESSVIWEPNPGPQTALVTSPVPEIFFGGARGGGKSDGLLGDFAIHAGEHGEHARGIIFRRTLPEFREIELRSKELYRKMGATYKAGDREWIFPNGARLVMRYLYDESDADNYQGHSYTWVGVDEAGNWPNPKAIDKMRGTLRSAHGVPTYMRLTGNPGGVGHLWLKERYIDPAPPYTPHELTPQPEERPDLKVTVAFIPSKLEDNPYLLNDPNYEASLAAAGGPALFRAWRYGDWNAVVGAAFREWRTDVHVERMDVIPEGWRIIAGMDWGFGAPGAFYTAALDPENRAYFFIEHYFNHKPGEPGTPPRDVGYDIGMKLKKFRASGQLAKFPEYIALDADSFHTSDGRGGKWQSTADLIQLGLNEALDGESIPVIAAPKGRGSRKSGKQIIHQMLRFDVNEEGEIPDHMAPSLKFHPRCEHAIRTIPALPLKENDPEDVDTDAEDHAYDAVRYTLAARNPQVVRTAKRAETFDVHPGLDSGGKRKPQPWEEEHKEGKITVEHKWVRIKPGMRRDHGTSVGW